MKLGHSSVTLVPPRLVMKCNFLLSANIIILVKLMAGPFRVLFYVGGRAGPPKSGIQPRLPQTCTRPPPGLGNCHDGDVSGPISLSVCSSTSVARPGRENLEINRGTLEWATLYCRGRFWPRFTLRVLFYVGGRAAPPKSGIQPRCSSTTMALRGLRSAPPRPPPPPPPPPPCTPLTAEGWSKRGATAGFEYLP